MSLSTSFTSSSQLYPSTSSDNQWSQDLHVLENQQLQQYPVSEQYTIIPACNGASATHNPKIANANHCINNQMSFNPPNYVNLYNPNGLNGQDIRFQNTYIIDNAGAMVPRNGNYIPNGNSSWASPIRRDRMIPRTTWNTPKPTTSGGVKKSKRIRTAFTSQQMMELENEYARARYLDRSRRIELSETLKLNERTIKIWFQNRRMKEKKDKTEANEETEATSTTESSPELGGPMAMYDPYPNNGVCDRNIYIEQYPVVSTMPQQNIVSCQVDEVNLLPNTYPTFFVENNMQLPDYESQCRQINMHLENYSINCKTEEKAYQPEAYDETSNSGNSTNEATAKSCDDANAENWDLSWIRSIQIDEDA